MNAIGQAVRNLRDERGWTLRDLADKLGMSHSNLHKKESGEVKISPFERKRIARAFGLSLDAFDQRWRASIVEQSRGGMGIPVINRAPAGGVVDYEEYGVDSGQGFEYLDRGDIDDLYAFAVIVTGDSMEPTLREGDVLVLSPMNVAKPKRQLKDGAIVFVRFSDGTKRRGCTLARYFQVEGPVFRLRKDNHRYPDLAATLEVDSIDPPSVDRIAVAIERRTKL